MKTVKLCSGHPVLFTCAASSKVWCWEGWGGGELCQPRTSPEMAGYTSGPTTHRIPLALHQNLGVGEESCLPSLLL